MASAVSFTHHLRVLRFLRVLRVKWNPSTGTNPSPIGTNPSLSKKPMQKPPHIPGHRILPIAAAEQPEPVPILILDPEIIPHRPRLATAFPPLAGDAFRTVGAAHAVAHAAPGERHRRMVRQQRHRLHRLRRIEQPHRPRQILAPQTGAPLAGPPLAGPPLA